jgi:ABC-2 type transport system permease protein
MTSVGACVAVITTAARQQTTYRAELLSRAVTMAIFMAVFMALWSTAFRTTGDTVISGFTFPMMIWYLIMTETVVLSTSRIFLEISESVKSGELAYSLVRPISYPLLAIMESLGNSLPRFATNLITGVIVVWPIVGTIAGSVEGLGAFLVVAVLGLVLDALVALIIGLSAFWIEDVTPVSWIYQKLLFTVGGMFVPLDFFPSWLRNVVDYLPFRLIVYAPAKMFVAFDFAAFSRTLLHMGIYLVIFGALVAAVWRAAKRRMVIQGG